MRNDKSRLVFFIPLVVLVIFAAHSGVDFHQNCSGHLELAAQANTVELARQELGHAVAYLKSKHMTQGYTSVCWNSPDEDIGFFYTNLTESLKELDALIEKKPEASALERSNCLLKLRDTLTDQGKDGTKVIYPDGLSRFPHNFWFGCFLVLSAVLACWGAVLLGEK